METYMGLVEVGVGLIPGGGGNVNLYQKHLKGLPNGVPTDYQHIANKVFESIAMAKTSTSAEEARENNFLDFADGISVNPDHLIYDAKQAALSLFEAGYVAPKKESSCNRRFRLCDIITWQLKECSVLASLANMI